MDVPSVKNARLGIQAFELLQLPLDKVVLVLNRADSKVNLVGPRRRAGPSRPGSTWTCPRTPLVPKSVNEGVPALRGLAEVPLRREDRGARTAVDDESGGPQWHKLTGVVGGSRR